jgi:hypothetical protein
MQHDRSLAPPSAHALLRLLWLGAAASWLCVGAARAQGMLHLMPPGPRPLHLRLAEADVIAIGTVGGIERGRIDIRDAVVLRGEAPSRFEVKRAPSSPPQLAVGLAAVLLLRGARPPYVLVDEPRELVVLRDADETRLWRKALQDLLEATGDRERLTTLYLDWLDGADPTLREVAGVALIDPRAGLLPLSAERARQRALVALDPDRSVETRRTSALLAATSSEGAEELLAGVPGLSPDAQVVEIALQAGFQLRTSGLEAALLRALDHTDATVRRTALRMSALFDSKEVRSRVRWLAAHDPNAEVRRKALQQLSEAGALPRAATSAPPMPTRPPMRAGASDP